MLIWIGRATCWIALITLVACGGGGSGGQGQGTAGSGGSGDSGAQDLRPDEAGFTYLQSSYRLPLSHQHEHGDQLFGDTPIASWGDNDQVQILTFDGNGWLHRKLDLDFDGWKINGAVQYGDQIWLPGSTEAGPLSLVYAHKSLDRVAFLSVDTEGQTGSYKLLDFGQALGSYGRWSAIHVRGGWLLARTFRTGQMGQSTDYTRINVQVVKIDLAGQVLASRNIETANIVDFGQAQVPNSSAYPPSLRLEKHFDDVLISGFSSQMQASSGSSLNNISSLWIPLNVANMTLRQPFWIQAERFKRAQFNDQPELNLYARHVTNTPAAWQAQGSFILGTGNAGYSPTNLNQGWLRAQLSPDYSRISLTTHGLRTGPTDYNWRFFSRGVQQVEARYEARDLQEQYTFVGNTLEVKALPVSKIDFNTCNAPGYGAFSFSNNCKQFDRFYALTENGSLRVRNSPAALNVAFVYDPYADDPTDTTFSVLNLQYPTSQKRLSLDLDKEHRHPGCTADRSYDAPSFPVISQNEDASLQKTPLPAVLTTSVFQASGPLRITNRPYHYRAPVLCSQYKISLDQRINVTRASDSQSKSVQPVLHPNYSRQIITTPAHGTYNAASNVYSPRPGFVGTDVFKIRINDSTGEQDVTIEVRVQ